MGRAGAKHQTFHGYRRLRRFEPIRGRLPPAGLPRGNAECADLCGLRACWRTLISEGRIPLQSSQASKLPVAKPPYISYRATRSGVAEVLGAGADFEIEGDGLWARQEAPEDVFGKRKDEGAELLPFLRGEALLGMQGLAHMG